MTLEKSLFQNIAEGIWLLITTPLACTTLATDDPLRLLDEDVLQLHPHLPDAGDTADSPSTDAEGDTTTSEIPIPMSSYDEPAVSPLECQPGELWPSANGGMPLCLRFSEKAADLGLQSAASAHNKVKVFDVDNDGDQDLYLLNGEDNANELFINNGEAGFIESAASFGLDIAGDSRDAVFGDYDQDGDNDLFLVGAYGSQIYENSGGVFQTTVGEKGIYNDEQGRTAKWIDGGMLLATVEKVHFYKVLDQGYFEEATSEAGFNDITDVYKIEVADYDGDNLKDVFLASSTGKCRLFRGLGGGQYEEDETTILSQIENAVDAEWVFLQPDDELPSLYVANFGLANYLFQNLGDGQFVNVAQKMKLQDPGNTTIARWGDLLGNGYPGVFLGRWNGPDTEELQPNMLYIPVLSEDGQQIVEYEHIQYPMGMAVVGKTVSAEWFDYDNDGQLDLVVVMADGAVYLYHNESHWVLESE